jgi:hypothetical protein
MSLARAWTRQLFGASGVALLVPGAVALALIALAVAGGFGQLGDLSQAFAGPAAPATVPVHAAPGTRGGTHAPAVLPVAVAAAPVTRPAATGGRAVGGGHGHAAPSTGSPQAGIGPVVTGGPGNGSSGTGGHTGTGGSPTGGGSPPSGSGGTPTLVDGVVGVGTKVTSQLPGSVGKTATGVLQSAGKTVSSLLPANGAQTVAGVVKTLAPSVQLP